MTWRQLCRSPETLIADIASRFGVIKFKISSEEHRALIAKIQTSSAARYDGALQDAMALIRAHRLP